jgi:hypothetical protein
MKPWLPKLERAWQTGLRKPDNRSMVEWAHENLTLPASYAVQGRFDISVNRPLEAVFDAIQNPLINKVRFRKPPRFGGSLIADIAIPWICVNDPGPIMWNWQTDSDAKAHMKEKAWALWNSCKPFRALLPPGRHDRTNTEIYFGPFFMVCQGANLSNLQSKGVRWMFNDELWLPVWQELYGHAEARVGDFKKSGSYKIVDVSQAGNAKDIEDRNWHEGHRARWGYLAPDGKHYPLEFSGKREDGTRYGLIWNDDAKREDGTYNIQRAVETCRYVCRHTGKEWFDKPGTQAEWNRDGKYIIGRTDGPASTVSFAVNGLLNYTMADLVEKKIKAMEMASYGDMSEMRDYKQKYECQPWEELNLTVTLSSARTNYLYRDFANGEQWEGEARRAMMMDRQGGARGDIPHRWVEIRAFQADGASRQLYFGRVNTKESCRELQLKFKIPDRCVWQDGNFEKHEVFKECSEYGWLAVFGTDQKEWAHFSKNPGSAEPTKVVLPYSPIGTAEVAGSKLRANYLAFNVDYISDVTANLLAGRGVAWEHPDDWSPEHKEHIMAEHKVEKKAGVFKWEKIGSRPNHGLDTTRYHVCFALVVKLLSVEKRKKETDALAGA